MQHKPLSSKNQSIVQSGGLGVPLGMSYFQRVSKLNQCRIFQYRIIPRIFVIVLIRVLKIVCFDYSDNNLLKVSQLTQ